MDFSKIRDDVIRRGFPELIKHNIELESVVLDDAIMDYGTYSTGGYFIEIDNNLNGVPVDVIEGGFAHEFAHIIADEQMSWYRSLFDEIAYKRSKKYKRKVEIRADITAILRGFGPQLIALCDYLDKNDYETDQEAGLSRLELERIVNTIVNKD